MVKIKSTTETYKSLFEIIQTTGSIQVFAENGGHRYQQKIIDKNTGVHLGLLCSFHRAGVEEQYMLIYNG